jgi:pimeloyl-ACP methyl ester carboxylesterase
MGNLFIVIPAGLAALIAALTLGGAGYHALSTARERQRYRTPGGLVDVGGHRLHLHSMGAGSPAVVMDAGAGGSSLDWHRVQPAVAAFTRACAYDRAGFGWSESGPAPRTSDQIAEELHSLLANASVPPPYVLVGHSFGGLNMRLFACKYPEEVAAIILLDATHEDISQRFPPEFKRLQASAIRLVHFGRVTASLGVPRLLRRPMAPANMSPGIQMIANAFGYRPSTYSTVIAEFLAFEESAAQVRGAGALPHVPVVVLTAGVHGFPSGAPFDQMEEMWRGMQQDLATLTPMGRQIIVESSGHFIQIDEPEIVISAIPEVVDSLRGVEHATNDR